MASPGMMCLLVPTAGRHMHMQRQVVTLRELLEQLYAEASRVSASGLDEDGRNRLDAIRRRIEEIRVTLGRTDG